MNSAIPICFCLAASLAAKSVQAQGTFKNLNFESASLLPTAPGQFPNFVPIVSAMPDWNGYLGTTQQTQVEDNVTTIGDANIAILGPTWSTMQPGIIDGTYSALLEAGAVPGGTGAAFIEQTGTIPANAESIQLKAWILGNPSDFGISFAGNRLTPVLLSSGVNYSVYGISIAPYAGQTGTLELSANFDTQGATWVNLDDIAFSTSAIPEPSPLALTGIGALVFALYRRFAPKRP
jgi:hypothetical protein